MGSRISRAVFANERKIVIGRERKAQLQQATVYFVSLLMVTLLFFYGLLFRPHVGDSNLAGGIALLLMSFLYFSKKAISSVILLASCSLLVVLIVAATSGVNLSFLRLTLNLLMIGFSALFCQTYLISHFFQALVLWCQFESFQLGLEVAKKADILLAADHKSENVLIKIVFYVLTIMLVVLATAGRKYLLTQHNQINIDKYVSVFHTIFDFIFNTSLLLFAFLLKSAIEDKIEIKLISIGVTLGMLLIVYHFAFFKYLCICAWKMMILGIILELLTEQEGSLLTSVLKVSSLSIMMIDTISKWAQSIQNGDGKPFFLVFIYLLCLVIGVLSDLSVPLQSYLNGEYIVLGLIASLHGVICLKHFERQKGYESIQ